MTAQQNPDQPAGRMARVARAVRRWPLPTGIVLGAMAGGAYGVLHTPQYAATSYVVVVPTRSDPVTALGYAQAYGRVATQTAVLADAHRRAGVPAQTLRTAVQAATSPDAPMIAVTGTASRPRLAAAMANAVAAAVRASAAHAEPDTGVKIEPFAEAVAPGAPVSISAPSAGLVGGCAGGLLGGLALLVRREGEQTGLGRLRRAAPQPPPTPGGVGGTPTLSRNDDLLPGGEAQAESSQSGPDGTSAPEPDGTAEHSPGSGAVVDGPRADLPEVEVDTAGTDPAPGPEAGPSAAATDPAGGPTGPDDTARPATPAEPTGSGDGAPPRGGAAHVPAGKGRGGVQPAAGEAVPGQDGAGKPKRVSKRAPRAAKVQPDMLPAQALDGTKDKEEAGA
jgi:capsular polysaccharide biosynthesis protein